MIRQGAPYSNNVRRGASAAPKRGRSETRRASGCDWRRGRSETRRANGCAPRRGRSETRRANGCGRRAAALLEVVLALAMFFGVAVILLGGLSACMSSVQQLRMSAKASDLAVSMLTEVQIGRVPVVSAGPTQFDDPLKDWTWEVAVSPVTVNSSSTAVPDLSRVDVIVRNTVQGYTQRLTDMIPTPTDQTVTTTAAGG
jgi:hypothetical protein